MGWARRANKDQLGFVLDIERGYWAKNQDDDRGRRRSGSRSRRATARVIPFVEDHRNCLLVDLADSARPDGECLAAGGAEERDPGRSTSWRTTSWPSSPCPATRPAAHPALRGGRRWGRRAASSARSARCCSARWRARRSTSATSTRRPATTCAAPCAPRRLRSRLLRLPAELPEPARPPACSTGSSITRAAAAACATRTVEASPTGLTRAEHLQMLMNQAGSRARAALARSLLEKHDLRLPSHAQKLDRGLLHPARLPLRRGPGRRLHRRPAARLSRSARRATPPRPPAWRTSATRSSASITRTTGGDHRQVSRTSSARQREASA